MAAVDFNQLFNNLLDGAKSIAKQQFIECVNEVTSTSISTLFDMKERLELWLEQLAAGDIDHEDLKYNIEGAMDAAQMVAMKQSALLLIHVDELKVALSNLIMQTLQTVIP